jgi:hypothetical protein
MFAIRRSTTTALAGIALSATLVLGVSACSAGTTSGSPSSASGETTADIALVGSTTDDGTTVLAATAVGDSVFVLGQNGSDIRFGSALNGSDLSENWMTFGEPVDVATDGFTVVNPSNFPDAAPGGIAAVSGQIGADVTDLEITTHTGDTVPVSVVGGYFVAAWEGRDFDDRDTLDAQFVLHLADGSTRTVAYLDAVQD